MKSIKNFIAVFFTEKFVGGIAGTLLAMIVGFVVFTIIDLPINIFKAITKTYTPIFSTIVEFVKSQYNKNIK